MSDSPISHTSVSEIFQIPKFYYFKSGNNYSGSRDSFSYIVLNGETLRCQTWHGRICSAKAVIENEKEFEKTEEGFMEMVSWLEKIYSEGK